MNKSYKVYVIENPSGKRYIGLSEDVPHRVDQHNASVSKWTAKHRPWTLVWTSETMSLSDARKLESHLKKAKGGNSFYEYTGLPRSSSGS